MEKKQQVREQSEQQPVLSDKRSNQPCVLLLKVANAYTWDPPSEQPGMHDAFSYKCMDFKTWARGN